jgi:hypothetical protein
MPETRVARDRIPFTDPRQRRVHHHPARDAVRVLRGERIADHVADVVRHESGVGDMQCIHHAGDIRRLVLLGVPAVGMS